MQNNHLRIVIAILVVMVLGLVSPVLYAWPVVNGIAISTVGNNQLNPTIVSDGSGGAIITWQDERFGNSNDDIYIQRVNSSGSTLWVLNGLAICSSDLYQENPAITSDGSGGAIITWQDPRDAISYDIYAQRVNSSGSPLWDLNGITICTAEDNQKNSKIVSDGSGGAIISWEDYRDGTTNGIYYNIYAQRVDSTGSTLWTLDGLAICTVAGDQIYSEAVSDGLGGAIITWIDFRDGTTNGMHYDIYAQRVNGNGSTLWTLNGLAICTAANDEFRPMLISDGSGGAIFCWEDLRNDDGSFSNYDIYAQRVNSTGSTLWILNGVSICTAGDFQFFPEIVSDGSDGAIVCWADHRYGNYDIYAQRINNIGSTLWTLDGNPVCSQASSQVYPVIVSNNSGGGIIAWEDRRNSTLNVDIYAQCIDSTGSTLWTLDGVTLCDNTSIQTNPQIISDGSGGAIITWQDSRNGSGYDIYAQRVDATGDTSGVPVELSSFEAVKED